MTSGWILGISGGFVTVSGAELKGLAPSASRQCLNPRQWHYSRVMPPYEQTFNGEGDNQCTWRAAFKQQGGEVIGTIIPLSGDWGTMTGKFENGQLRLTRFDGINAYLLNVKMTADGKLEGMINSERKVVAERADKAQLAALPPLPDPNNYTKLKNPNEPFQFSFPDLDGKTVASTDERFRNKVVIVTIGGTWCPNCHEEAAVLRDFFQRYQKNRDSKSPA